MKKRPGSCDRLVELDGCSCRMARVLRPSSAAIDRLAAEVKQLLPDRQARRILILTGISLLTLTLVFNCLHRSNSITLTCSFYLVCFDVLRLLIALLSIWLAKRQRSLLYTFGVGRFEVLAVFSATVLTILGSVFVVKESVERILFDFQMKPDGLLIGSSSALANSLLVTWLVRCPALEDVVSTSASSWLQVKCSQLAALLCQNVPVLTRFLLPRFNPFVIISLSCFVHAVLVDVVVSFYDLCWVDTLTGIWLSSLMISTMIPMAFYTGAILLQTTPSYMIDQLEKSLREAQTLDGVLELRHEYFWMVSFGRMTGSVHVRIRRDANEQLVLAHVYSRLSRLVPLLTVQLYRESWTNLASSSSGPPSVGRPNFSHSSQHSSV